LPVDVQIPWVPDIAKLDPNMFNSCKLWDAINAAMTSYMRRQFFIDKIPDKEHYGRPSPLRYPTCRVSFATTFANEDETFWTSGDIYHDIYKDYGLEGPWDLRDKDEWFDYL
jgi:hypothetical protein